MKTLKEAKIGTTVTVAKLQSKRRIMDMGLTGKRKSTREWHLLGDPIEVTVRGYGCRSEKAMRQIQRLI